MNLNMIQPKNETEDLLLSIFKKCETFIKQTHARPEESLEFKINQPREIFHFNPSNYLGPDSDWMVGLVTLHVCN